MPKNIHNELRLTCCLKGFSAIKFGHDKTQPKQEAYVYKFYHRKAPNRPSQIKVLPSASYLYRKLYNGESRSATKKTNNHDTVYKHSLIPELSLDMARKYIVGVDINHMDLEKMNKSSKALIWGRQLLRMAREGLKHYRKEMSLCVYKLDTKTNQPKESGSSIDDVVDYVCHKMYEVLVTSKEKYADSDSNSEGEEIIAENETNEEEDIGEDKEHTMNPTADNTVVPDIMCTI